MATLCAEYEVLSFIYGWNIQWWNNQVDWGIDQLPCQNQTAWLSHENSYNKKMKDKLTTNL